VLSDAQRPAAWRPASEAPASEAPASEAPASEAPASEAPEGGATGLRRALRLGVIVVVLAALALAGVLVGRQLREEGGSRAQPTAPATVPAATAPKPAPARPAAIRWGPLVAAPAGKLAVASAGAAVAVPDARVVVAGGSAGTPVQLGRPGHAFARLGTLPSPLASAAAFASGGAAYVIGGEHGGAAPSDRILRIELGSGAVTVAGRFVEPLAGAGYAQRGDALLLAGGWTGTQYATAILRFTLPGTATLVARLPVGLRDPAVALVGGTLYVAGGRNASGPTDRVFAVRLDSGGVEVRARLPRAVSGATLVSAGGALYLLGGRATAGPVADVVRIDPATGRAERAGSMPRPLAGAAAVRAGGGTYVLGGTAGSTVWRLTAP
jgi:hypothetical protein